MTETTAGAELTHFRTVLQALCAPEETPQQAPSKTNALEQALTRPRDDGPSLIERIDQKATELRYKRRLDYDATQDARQTLLIAVCAHLQSDPDVESQSYAYILNRATWTYKNQLRAEQKDANARASFRLDLLYDDDATDAHERTNAELAGDMAENWTAGADIRQALAHLPETQRTALILTTYAGLTATETAERMETTTSAVYSLVKRAKTQLADLLPDYAPPPTTAHRRTHLRAAYNAIHKNADPCRPGDLPSRAYLTLEDGRQITAMNRAQKYTFTVTLADTPEPLEMDGRRRVLVRSYDIPEAEPQQALDPYFGPSTKNLTFYPSRHPPRSRRYPLRYDPTLRTMPDAYQPDPNACRLKLNLDGTYARLPCYFGMAETFALWPDDSPPITRNPHAPPLMLGTEPTQRTTNEQAPTPTVYPLPATFGPWNYPTEYQTQHDAHEQTDATGIPMPKWTHHPPAIADPETLPTPARQRPRVFYSPLHAAIATEPPEPPTPEHARPDVRKRRPTGTTAVYDPHWLKHWQDPPPPSPKE